MGTHLSPLNSVATGKKKDEAKNLNKRQKKRKGVRTCSGIPCRCWCTHETLSCLLHNFQEFLKLQLLLLNLHPRLLRGLVEITPTLTPVSIGAQRMLLTLNTSLASMLAGGAGGTELGRAALLQGAKNVLVPLFVNVSKQQRQARKEGPCCAWCQLL